MLKRACSMGSAALAEVFRGMFMGLLRERQIATNL